MKQNKSSLMMSKLVYMFSLLLLLVPGLVAAQGGDVTGLVSGVTLNVREAPNASAAKLGQLPGRTPVTVEARNGAGDWFLVRAPEAGLRGWVAAGYITLERPVRIEDEIPFSDEVVSAAAADPANVDEGEPAPPPVNPAVVSERTDYPEIYMPPAVMNNVRNIYGRGQQRGNNPFSLIKVGDSNMDGDTFLCNFERLSSNLGEYEYLTPTVQGFSGTGSLCKQYLTGRSGWSTARVLDPALAPAESCEPNETPLACEVRRSAPAYAIVYIGTVDNGLGRDNPGRTTAAQFETNLTYIVRQLSEWGVVPIMATFATADIYNTAEIDPQSFNDAIRRVARAQNLPLIDVRSATYDFENRGVTLDGFHLSTADPAKSSFDGGQFEYGLTYFEFQTLQVLHELHNAFNG